MFEDNFDTCFGCVIALVNSLNSIDEYPDYFEDVVSCLHDLKKRENTQYWINVLRNHKRVIVPDCFTCQNPCGRTSEVSLNELGLAYQRKAISLLLDLDNLTNEEIFYRIGALTFE